MNVAAKIADIGDNIRSLVTVDQLAKDYAHVEQAIAAFEARGAEAPPIVEDDEDLAQINTLVIALRDERKRVVSIGDAETKPYYNAHKTAHSFFNQLVTRLSSLQEQLEHRGKRYLDKKHEAARKAREEAERKAREEARRLEQEAVVAAQAGKPQEATAAMTAAVSANDRADDAGAAARAKPADMARTHTAGGTASLAEGIEFAVTDWSKLDLEILRPYIRRDEIDKAIRALVRARRPEIETGKLTIAGVQFRKTTKANFR
jgi:hypothetical protein